MLFSRSLGNDVPLSLDSNLRYGRDGLVVRKAREKGICEIGNEDGEETGEIAGRPKKATSEVLMV